MQKWNATWQKNMVYKCFGQLQGEINKFYQSQEKMLGLCQNVEIIHQHHHHFYEVVVAPKSRNRSLLSKTANPESFQHLPSPSSTSFRNQPEQEALASKFYRSKRAYLKGNQKGIEVLSRRMDRSFQVQRINLQKAEKNQHYQYPQTSTPLIPQAQRCSLVFASKDSVGKLAVEGDYVQFMKKSEISKINGQKINQYLDESIQKSTPTVCKNQNSHQAALKANQYFNLHQLKQSKMGFKNASVCNTTKKNRQITHKMDSNISLSIPADFGTKPKNYYHQSSEIYLRDNDSILTKKENQILSAFKTQKMFDDAKSIVSLQSLQNSRLNIDESIIVSRTMDYFTNITAKRQLLHCSLYLARDNNIHWLVSIREFEFKHEEASLKEAKLYTLLSSSGEEGANYPVLALYRMMMEGSGLSKNIFFILEPFQLLLNDYLESKKTYFKSVPSAFNYFLQDFAGQIFQALFLLNEKKMSLIEAMEIGDFAIVNGRYKFHSLFKFQALRPQRAHTHESILASVEKLKSSIIESVIFS